MCTVQQGCRPAAARVQGGAWNAICTPAARGLYMGGHGLAQQLVGTVHMASQVLVLGGILLVDWPWRARVWHLPGIHIEMGAPYEDIR